MNKYYALLSILLFCLCSTKEQETEKLPVKKAKLSIAQTHMRPVEVDESFLSL